MMKRAIALLVLLQLAAVFGVLGLSYVTGQGIILSYADRLTQRIARDTTAFTTEFLTPAADAALLTRRLARSQVLATADRDRLARYFFEILQTRSDFSGLYLGRPDGSFTFVSRDEDPATAPFTVKQVMTRPVREVTLVGVDARFVPSDPRTDPDDDYDPRTRPWYVAAARQDGVAWTAPYVFFTSRRPGITVSAPVTGGINGEFRGVVGVDIEIDALSAFLETLDISARGAAAIVAQDGTIIAHRDPDLLVPAQGDSLRLATLADGNDPILARAADSIKGGIDDLFPGEIRLARFQAGGETWRGAVQRLPLERTPWTVMIYLPEADILGPLSGLVRRAVALGLIAAALTVFVLVVFGRRMLRG